MQCPFRERGEETADHGEGIIFVGKTGGICKRQFGIGKNYGLDRWLTLPRYIPEEDTRLLLKNCYRQYRQYSKVQTVLKNNLVSLLDTVFPNANRLFSSPIRRDGSEKWVDFVAEFWHCRCVSEKSEKAFTSKYQRWCRKHGYNFREEKAHTIHAEASGHIGVMPKSETTKLLVEQAVSQLRATSAALAALKQEMQTLASTLPEYPVVIAMFGVGPTLGPQLIAEIGDVRRFYSKKALVMLFGLRKQPCFAYKQSIKEYPFMKNLPFNRRLRQQKKTHGPSQPCACTQQNARPK